MVAVPKEFIGTLAGWIDSPMARLWVRTVMRGPPRWPVMMADGIAERTVLPPGSEPSPFLDEVIASLLADGPLAGEVVAVKDSTDLAGTRTGFGLSGGF